MPSCPAARCQARGACAGRTARGQRRQLGDLCPGVALAADQPLAAARSQSPAAAAGPTICPSSAGWAWRGRQALHGRGFWIRPLAIELFAAIGLPALYWWEITQHLAPPVMRRRAATTAMLHQEFRQPCDPDRLHAGGDVHRLRRKNDSRRVTIPGTLIGLLLAAAAPDSLLPVVRVIVVADRAFGLRTAAVDLDARLARVARTAGRGWRWASASSAAGAWC